MINSSVLYKAYDGVFSNDECRRIELAARSIEKKEGKVIYDGSDIAGISDKQLRNSDIRFIAEQWIYEKVQQLIVQANQDGLWNLSITDMEPLQLAEYGPGGYYDWHFDALGAPYDRSSRYPGKVRKLSMSVLINDSDEFDGGDFEVHAGYRNNAPVTRTAELVKTGDVIVFPSLIPHRVAPVTWGIRKSLVCWVVGPPFV